jgi:DNA-binding GntR family transcriptional regulator
MNVTEAVWKGLDSAYELRQDRTRFSVNCASVHEPDWVDVRTGRCAHAMNIVSNLDTSALEARHRGGPLYEAIREDIISGRLPANARLVVAELAERHGTSTNPIREALQQLRGEGFVVMAHNRGARVRPIDEDFIRDIYEIEVLIEPALTRWFVGIASGADIEALEALHAEMLRLNYSDPARHGLLDTQFHHTMYARHYNRHAADLWWKHREILRAISRRLPISVGRQASVMREHQEVLDAIKAQDADAAAATIARHVEGSGRHIIEQMRATRRNHPKKVD